MENNAVVSGMSNPFRVLDTADGPVQVGALPESETADFGPNGVETVIGVARSDTARYTAVLRITGVLWEPAEGAVVQLREPDRDATVVAQYNMVIHGRLASVICLDDPMVDRRPEVGDAARRVTAACQGIAMP